LSPFDDKRYIRSDGITSYSYGHKKLIDYCNYMSPEEVARRMIGSDIIDASGIGFKRLNNILSTKGKNRSVERRDKRAEKKKPSKEASKTVAMRLQKKLIERGKTPNLGANVFA